MYFEVLLALEVGLCAFLVGAVGRPVWKARGAAPEVDLGRRAWVAARFGMTEAQSLGPLFQHLVRATRFGLREAHRLQEQVRGERAGAGPWRPLAPVWRGRRTGGPGELQELSHLVEQLEQLACAIARYRAGIGMLGDMRIPLKCLQATPSGRRPVMRA